MELPVSSGFEDPAGMMVRREQGEGTEQWSPCLYSGCGPTRPWDDLDQLPVERWALGVRAYPALRLQNWDPGCLHLQWAVTLW